MAAAIVGAAILLGGPAARILNAVGALFWLASAVLLALSLPAVLRQGLGWLAAVVCGLVLAAIVRPGSPGEAIVAFGVAGALVVLAAGDRSGAWALLVPAIYLPAHLVIGIGRAILRGAAMRTEPPPTAAVVPLTMLLATVAAGALAAAVVRRFR